MFPSKVAIASSNLSINQTLNHLLQKLGWDDICIFETVEDTLESSCLKDQDIVLFFDSKLIHSKDLPRSLKALRNRFQGILILILDLERFDFQSQENLADLVDGFIVLPVNEQHLKSTLIMAKQHRQRKVDLLKSEDKFWRLFHNSDDPKFLVYNGVFIDCNQAALELLKASKDDLIGKTPAEISPPIQPDGCNSAAKAEFLIEHALKNGYVQFEWLHRRFDGTEFLTEVSLTSIPYHDGQAIHAKWHDVTEAEQIRKSFYITEKRYKELFETMLNGFALHEIILNEQKQPVNYRFLTVNPAFEKLTGLKAEHIIGKTVLEVLPNTEHYWIETYGKVALSGEPALIENYSRELEKHFRVYAFSPVQGQFATLFEDITLEKENERYQSALLKLSEKIRHAYTTVDMAKTVAHTIGSMLEIDTIAIALKSSENERLYHIIYGTGKAKKWIGAEFPKDQGITGYALRSKSPYFQNNLLEDPYYLRDFRHYYDPCIAAVPLISGNEAIGALILGKSKSFTDRDQKIITAMGELVGNALQRMILQEKTQQTVDYLSALRKIDMTITHGRDMGERLNVLLEAVIEHQKVDAASIWLWDAQTDFYKLSAAKGFDFQTLPNLSGPVPGVRADTTQIVHLQHAKLISALEGDFSNIIKSEGFISYMGIPLTTKKNHWGILQLWKSSEIKPTHEWMDFLEMLSGQAAIAIEDIQLLTDLQYHINELQVAYDTTLQGWAKALELRDAETQNHSHRVTQITLELARRLGLDESQLPHIRRGTLLHDIGKMGIPDAILNKPGPLTDEEWKIMRKHPQMAYDILSHIPFLKPALDIPYCHHEKWDGSGYPNGLKGEEIPLAARIFAVVDVWDALLSDRPYRPAWKKEEVIEYLREQSGKQFDPKVVEAFLQLIAEMENQRD